MTDAMFSKPSPRKIPSAEVGMALQVPSNSLPFMPLRYGVYSLGSHKSVCAMPPGSQIIIMASAVGLIAASSARARAANPAPAAASALVCKNVRRLIFIWLNGCIEIPG